MRASAKPGQPQPERGHRTEPTPNQGIARAQGGADSEVGIQQSPTALATAPSVVPLGVHLPWCVLSLTDFRHGP